MKELVTCPWENWLREVHISLQAVVWPLNDQGM